MSGWIDELPEVAAIEAAAAGREGEALPPWVTWGFVGLAVVIVAGFLYAFTIGS